jgi:hypothetical protein
MSRKVFVTGDPVLWQPAAKIYVGYAIKKVPDDTKYQIRVCRSGELKVVDITHLNPVKHPHLADGFESLSFGSLQQLFSSAGLDKRLLAHVTEELTDSLLDLCDQAVDDYDVLIDDFESLGFSDNEVETLATAVLYAMSMSYAETGADMSGPSAKEHDASAQISRFLRYCSFLKKSEHSDALNSVAKSNILSKFQPCDTFLHFLLLLLTHPCPADAGSWKKQKEENAAKTIARFIRYAAAINSGNSVLFSSTWILSDKLENEKAKKKKSSSSLLKIKHAPSRKSMYEGDMYMEGMLSKYTSNGMTKRWLPRYFTLRGHYLKYYENQQKKEVKGVMDMNHCLSAQLELVDFSTRKIVLTTTQGAPLQLKGPTNAMEVWIKAIDEVVRKAKQDFDEADKAVDGGSEEEAKSK